jgi:hypothetical protein
MEKSTERIIEKFAAKKAANNESHRADLVLIGLNQVGMRDRGYVFLARIYYDKDLGQPTRAQLQGAVNDFLGSSDPHPP